jgi:probable HAF family extracellular repeat protein
VAFSGNSKGQVVGNSLSDCDHETHAFLWENGGPMVDLNSFVPPGSGILLLEGVFIGESGEIAVSGRLANGDVHAFVLVPDVGRNGGTGNPAQVDSALDPSPAVSHAPVSPEKIAAFAARFAHRSPGFGLKPSKSSWSRLPLPKVAAIDSKTGPVVTLNPGSLGFKCVQYQYLCYCNSPQIVTLTNVGGATLGIESIALANRNDGFFSENNTCGASLEAGQSCDINVTVGRPSQLGNVFDKLDVTDNAADSPQALALDGRVNCRR